MNRALTFAYLMFAACDAQPVDEIDGTEIAGLAAELMAPPPVAPPSYGGCGDVYLYASNSTDTVGMSIWAPDLIAQANTLGVATLVVDFDLPDPGVTVQFRVGRNITINECNDVIFTNPVVRQRWRPVSGHATLSVAPDPATIGFGAYAFATVTLTDLVVEEISTGAQRALPDMVLSDVFVGWLAG